MASTSVDSGAVIFRVLENESCDRDHTTPLRPVGAPAQPLSPEGYRSDEEWLVTYRAFLNLLVRPCNDFVGR